MYTVPCTSYMNVMSVNVYMHSVRGVFYGNPFTFGINDILHKQTPCRLEFGSELYKK